MTIATEQRNHELKELIKWAKAEYKAATGEDKAIFYETYLNAVEKLEELSN